MGFLAGFINNSFQMRLYPWMFASCGKFCGTVSAWFDAIVYPAVVFFPLFYTVQNLSQRNWPLWENTKALYKENVVSDVTKVILLFGPAQTLNFTLTPARYR